jgi:hypothetical protein
MRYLANQSRRGLMPTIREQFHTIANWHNKITMAAGCTKELLIEKPLTSLSREELEAKQKEIVSIFGEIENDALSADQKVMEFKEYIYKTVNPETRF